MMKSKLGTVRVVCALLTVACAVFCADLSAIRKALDLQDVAVGSLDQTKVQLLYQKAWKDTYDDRGDLVSSKEDTSSPWSVGKSEKTGAASTEAVDFSLLVEEELMEDLMNEPSSVMGEASKSYVCSSWGKGKDYDARRAQLVFQVYGSGKFYYSYKSSTDSANYFDGLRILVDGDEVFSATEEYYEDEYWNWNIACYEISQVYADADGFYLKNAGTNVHEVVFEFIKDAACYEEDDNEKLVYVADGPEKPIKSGYDGDTDWYKEDLAVYEAFQNKIWLDGLVWDPTPLVLEFEDEDTSYLDEKTICVSNSTNVSAQGYVLTYTTDGSEPQATSPVYDEVLGITVSEACTVTLRVFMYDKTGALVPYVPARSISKQVTMDNVKASVPEFHVDFDHSKAEVPAFGLSKSWEGNSIYYTTDGTEPSSGSTLYKEGDVIYVEAASTLKAICCRKGINASDVVATSVEEPGAYFKSCVVSLESGWNLVSFPFHVIGESVAEFPEGVQASAWNGCACKEGVSLPEGTAYWMFNPGKESVAVTVHGLSEGKMGALESGWNAVGVTEKTDSRKIRSGDSVWYYRPYRPAKDGEAAQDACYIHVASGEYEDCKGYFVFR